MIPGYTHYRRVEPYRCVEVLDNGTWYHGELHAWRRDEYGWEAFVFLTIASQRFVRWVDQACVRPINVCSPFHDLRRTGELSAVLPFTDLGSPPGSSGITKMPRWL